MSYTIIEPPINRSFQEMTLRACKIMGIVIPNGGSAE